MHFDFPQSLSMVNIIGNYFKIHDSREEVADKIHRDCYPVITGFKNLDNNIIEIRRAYIYRKFFNTVPYPEEVIRIDKSKLGKDTKPTDIILESFSDYVFKKESFKMYAIGYVVKK